MDFSEKERKQLYIDHLPAADKLHNARSIVSDLRKDGAAVWKRFNAGPDDQLWYYQGIITVLRHGWSHRIIDELEMIVDEMSRLASR